jgi:hypothetical protein
MRLSTSQATLVDTNVNPAVRDAVAAHREPAVLLPR